MSKFYKCGRCWRKATHSIGFLDNQHHLCNKHWKRCTEAIRRDALTGAKAMTNNPTDTNQASETPLPEQTNHTRIESDE